MVFCVWDLSAGTFNLNIDSVIRSLRRRDDFLYQPPRGVKYGTSKLYEGCKMLGQDESVSFADDIIDLFVMLP